MTWWPSEYEALRPEARQMAEAVVGGLPDLAGDGPGDRDDRVRGQRELLASFEVRAPAGEDDEVGGVPCRVFRPSGPARATYLHFHGGAFIMGSPLLNDTANAALSERLDVEVVSADYRLAPEHPFPAGADDCLAVVKSLLGDSTGPLLVGGESAGAYFAALTLLRARDELESVERFAGANLVFGVYDLSGTPSNRGTRPTDLPDMLDPVHRPFINECYLPGRSYEDARDPSISPLFADLRGLPPALFTVGLGDHLLDDTLFMAARWQAYGNETELAVYPDCGHGFTAFPMGLARRANERIESFLDGALGG